MLAASRGQEDAVMVLLKHHADVHALTGDGNFVPLVSAVAVQSVPCVELLVKNGTKPIQIAVKEGNRVAVEALLPATQRIQSVPEWCVDGVIEFMQSECRREQAINSDPTDGILYSNRSICWLRLGQGEHYVMPRPAENLDQIGRKLIIEKVQLYINCRGLKRPPMLSMGASRSPLEIPSSHFFGSSIMDHFDVFALY